jgi:hypothetical protein
MAFELNGRGYIGTGAYPNLLILQDLWSFGPDVPQGFAEAGAPDALHAFISHEQLVVDVPSIVDLTVSDIRGACILRTRSSAGRSSIDVSALPCGVYLITTSDGRL